MNKINVCIVGGDLRFVRLAKILVREGFKVSVFGLCHPDLPQDVKICTCLSEIQYCPYIIGPIPFSKDGKCLYTPMCNEYISIEQFFLASQNSFVLGSVLKPSIRTLFKKHHISYCDIFDMDEIAILNAIPTAEGAIQYAMQHSEITIHNSRSLVMGFGRCGKILAHKLNALGAHVSVEARSTTDLSFISTYGYRAIPLNELKSYLGEFDFIFNTVPIRLLNASCIDLLNPDVIYIEIASVPGGIDTSYAESHHIMVVPAPSLPGIVAPTTAADILYQCLLLILNDQGAKL